MAAAATETQCAKAEKQAVAAAQKMALALAAEAGLWQNIAEFSAADFLFLQKLKPHYVRGQALDLRHYPWPPPFACDALFIRGLENLPRPRALAFMQDFLPGAAEKIRPGGLIALIERLDAAAAARLKPRLRDRLQKLGFRAEETRYFPPRRAAADGENRANAASGAKPFFAAHFIRNAAFLLAERAGGA